MKAGKVLVLETTAEVSRMSLKDRVFLSKQSNKFSNGMLPRAHPLTSHKTKIITPPLTNGATDINFETEVDMLMKAIQAKSQPIPPQTNSPVAPSGPVVSPPFTPPYIQTSSQGGMQTGDESKFKLTGEDVSG
jgi:hypothetical protein